MIDFEDMDEEEALCGLISRLGHNDSFLLVGFTSDTDLRIISIDPVTDPFVESFPLDISARQPVHLSYIAQGDELSVFINGEVFLDHLELNSSFSAEVDGPMVVAAHLDEGCAMTGVWGVGLSRD
jgi:hypothetical protein